MNSSIYNFKLSLVLFLLITSLISSCKSLQKNQDQAITDSVSLKIDNCAAIAIDSLWTTINNNGKGDQPAHYQTKTSHHVLENYYENLSIIDPYSVNFDKDYYLHFANDSLIVDSIGKWGNYIVYQVSNFLIMHRSVLLKDYQNNYRILYTEFDHLGSPLNGLKVYAKNSNSDSQPLTITEMCREMRPVIKDNMLIIQYFVGGNSEYYEYLRFKLDSISSIPILFN